MPIEQHKISEGYSRRAGQAVRAVLPALAADRIVADNLFGP